MAANSNRIRLTDTKGKNKGKTEATDYTLPRFPLPRRTALDWNAYTRHKIDGRVLTRLYVNIHKAPDSLDERMARALELTLPEYHALPENVKQRFMRDIDMKSSPVPTSIFPGEIPHDLYLEFENDDTFKPRLIHKGDALDVDAFSDLAMISQTLWQKHLETNALDVPLKFVLDSFGVLELKPVTVKDAQDGNAEKISHFAATNHRQDATALSNAIHITQKKRREDRLSGKTAATSAPETSETVSADTSNVAPTSDAAPAKEAAKTGGK